MALPDQPKTATAEVSPAEGGLPPRVSSAELFQGRTMVEIDHGGQRYLLRVTRENKLILTK